MKTLLVAASLLLPAAAAAQSLGGSYVYQSPAGPVHLVLEQREGELVGTMTGADGAVFQLQGAVEDGAATGTIRVGEGAGWFAVGFVGEGLKLVVAEVDPTTGEPDLNSGWDMDFVRTHGGAPGAAASGPGNPLTTPAAPAPGAGGGRMTPGTQQPDAGGRAEERDPALVGSWGYSDTYVSGDFSATTRLSMQINPDGTYLYGNGDVSLGGDYIGRGSGGDVTRGRWRTQGGVVYVMEEGSPQWVPYARYYVEGASVLFTFGDGKRQVWTRRGH